MPAGTQSAVLGLPPSQPAARVARGTARGTRFPSRWTPVSGDERPRGSGRRRQACSARAPRRGLAGSPQTPAVARSRPRDPAAASLAAVRAGSLRRPRVLPRQVVRGRPASANAGPARTRPQVPRSGAVRAAGLRHKGGRGSQLGAPARETHVSNPGAAAVGPALQGATMRTGAWELREAEEPGRQVSRPAAPPPPPAGRGSSQAGPRGATRRASRGGGGAGEDALARGGA